MRSGRFQRKRCYGSFLSLLALFLYRLKMKTGRRIIHAIKMRARRTGQFRPISCLFRERKRQGKKEEFSFPRPFFRANGVIWGPFVALAWKQSPGGMKRKRMGMVGGFTSRD